MLSCDVSRLYRMAKKKRVNYFGRLRLTRVKKANNTAQRIKQ